MPKKSATLFFVEAYTPNEGEPALSLEYGVLRWSTRENDRPNVYVHTYLKPATPSRVKWPVASIEMKITRNLIDNKGDLPEMDDMLAESYLDQKKLVCFDASIEILVYLVAIRMTSYVQIYDVNDSLINVYGGVISAMVLILALLVIRYVLKKEDPARLTGMEMAKFLAFPIASISMTVAFAYFNKGREVPEQEIRFFAFIAIIFLVSNVYMYWLLRTDVANKIVKEKSLMTEAHARELFSLYEQIREEHKAIAGIEHEYKNHMTVISSLAASRKIEELNEYLSELKESVTTVDVIDTGNAVCSALFNAKYAEAARKGIRVRFDISNLEDMKIKDEEMVIILSNLFNNAIESCENCLSKKIIELKIDYSNDVLFIAFTNSCNEETVDRDKTPKHGKDTSLMHGHGLSNIQRIVDSYGGQIDIIKNERFTVRLIIPCGEEK